MANIGKMIATYIGYFILLIAGILLTYHGISTDKGNLIVIGCVCIFISIIIPIMLFLSELVILADDDDYEPSG